MSELIKVFFGEIDKLLKSQNFIKGFWDLK
jgi:hypothetical protein